MTLSNNKKTMVIESRVITVAESLLLTGLISILIFAIREVLNKGRFLIPPLLGRLTESMKLNRALVKVTLTQYNLKTKEVDHLLVRIKDKRSSL